MIVDEEKIVVGDKVDLVAHQGRVYRTMVEDRVENGPFLVGVPSRSGTFMPMYIDDDVFLVFYRESGRYIAKMQAVGFEKRGDIQYVWLMQKTLPQRDQRREAYRVPVRIDVQVCEYSDNAEEKLHIIEDIVDAIVIEAVGSKDISITGIALMTRLEYKIEEKYLLRIFFDEVRAQESSFPAFAEVMRIDPWRETKMYNVGMQFFGHPKSFSERLARYVLIEQQKELQKRKQRV